MYCWAEKGHTLSGISVRIKMVFEMSIKSINDRAFYMKIYSNPITIAIPIFCSVTNELTAFSHMRITMQNPALLMDSQDTADGTPSTKTSNVIPPRKKKKRKGCKNTDSNGKKKMWQEKIQHNIYKKHCTVCQRTFAVAHGELFDVKQHASSDLHIKNVRDNLWPVCCPPGNTRGRYDM